MLKLKAFSNPAWFDSLDWGNFVRISRRTLHRQKLGLSNG